MRFIAKLLEHWKLYLIPILLFPIVATIYGQHKLSIYESSAYMLVERGAVVGSTTLGGISGGNPYASPAQNAVDAIGELLQSKSFLVKVAQSTDLATQYDLNVRRNQDIVATWIQADVSVTPFGMETFYVVVDDKSPRLTQQIASSLIVQFSSTYTQRQIDDNNRAEGVLEQQVAQASSQVTQDQQRINQYKNAHPSVVYTPDDVYATYQQQYLQDQTQLKNTQDQLAQLRLNTSALQSGTLSVFRTLDPPLVPLQPTLKLKKLLVYTGGGLGLALALIALIVGLLTISDRSIYSQQDVRSIIEDLDMDITSIEAVPVLHGIGERVRDEDEGATYSGVLVPVLTVLPQLSADRMTQEIRHAVGIAGDETR
ncbi:MAG TPA: hypothetical protein VF510_11515 [Ktedonobacterales bacterium]